MTHTAATTSCAHGASCIIQHANAIMMVTVLMTAALDFKGIDFFSIKSATCFLYKSDCKNQRCRRAEPLAKQNKVSM